jgi:hypothetical protein
MDRELNITGAIVDSWVERAKTTWDSTRVILQVVSKDRPGDLLIVQADASLVPDRGWLEDLGENMCHGSPVAAVGRLTLGGLISATQIQLVR